MPITMALEQERLDRLARLSPKRTVPTATLLRAYAELDALRDAVARALDSGAVPATVAAFLSDAISTAQPEVKS